MDLNEISTFCMVPETEEEKIKGKLKVEFDDNKCVTRRGLSLEDYKIFISQFSEM